MTQFWEDKWIGGLRLLDVFPHLYSFAFDSLSVVAHNGTWEGSSVNTLLDMLHDLQIFSYKQDYRRWIYDKDGGFSMKSAYLWLQRLLGGELRYSSDFQLVTKSLWKCKVSIKCLVFCWQVFLNVFLCKSLLQVRGVELDNNLCSFRSLFVEDLLHLFLMCLMTFNTWLVVANWLEVAVVLPNSLISLYLY
uniref:Reverse transcriptase zinc-binding domain-containing protein n=1 Tax=Cajanus cajan TaxID=3821 RepID=A0A151REK7_CAJCA|nr:hypothetical protein KK1_037676 [Cajanus cajan]